MTWTHTTRGRALDLLAPVADDVDLAEVAAALGRQCRYNGCVQRFYSVAEHSCLMAGWFLEGPHDDATAIDLALGALLHDAAEAYTGDITWPVQQVLWAAAPAARTAYQAMQARLDALIAAAAGIDVELLHHEQVKRADLRILLDERDALLPMPSPRPWPIEVDLGLGPLGVAVECWGPEDAAARWLGMLEALSWGARKARRLRSGAGQVEGGDGQVELEGDDDQVELEGGGQ